MGVGLNIANISNPAFYALLLLYLFVIYLYIELDKTQKDVELIKSDAVLVYSTIGKDRLCNANFTGFYSNSVLARYCDGRLAGWW